LVVQKLFGVQSTELVLHVEHWRAHLEQVEGILIPRKEHELVETSLDVGAAVVPVHPVEVRSAAFDGRVIGQRSTADAFEICTDIMQYGLIELAPRNVDVARRDVVSHLLQTGLVGEERAGRRSTGLDLRLSLVQVSHSMSSVHQWRASGRPLVGYRVASHIIDIGRARVHISLRSSALENRGSGRREDMDSAE
jgi:hypothetical protein